MKLIVWRWVKSTGRFGCTLAIVVVSAGGAHVASAQETGVMLMSHAEVNKQKTEPRAFTISVQGMVRRPGEYVWEERMIVSDAIEKAGGLLSTVKPTDVVVVVIRRGEKGTSSQEVSVKDPILADDAVQVRPRKK